MTSRFAIRVRFRAVALLSAVLAAQTFGLAAQAGPTFEVASVKPTQSPGYYSAPHVEGDRFVAIHVALRTLIAITYNKNGDHILGGPKWIAPNQSESAYFDINAKAEGKPSKAEWKQMLKALLAERFKLVTHIGSRQDEAVFVLRTKSDGNLGAQLHHSTTDCMALRRSNPKDANVCGYTDVNGRLEIHGITMDELASMVSQEAGRRVINKTELLGTYDVELSYQPKRFFGSSTYEDRPSMAVAIQEQLGLRLDAEKAPGEFLIIDHAEMPTPE